MTAIFTRSALEYWSGVFGRQQTLAPDVHSVVIDGTGPHATRRVVTYTEHMAAKRERQAGILDATRRVEHWQAWRLSVWFFSGYSGWIYRGWHAYLDRYDGRHEWLKGGDQGLLDLFPLVLRLGDERDDWQRWMAAFVCAYPRGRRCGKPRGATVIWRRGHEMRLTPDGERILAGELELCGETA